MDTQYVLTMLKLCGGMLGISAIIGVLLLLTPRLARFIDRHRKPREEEPDDGLQDPYGTQKDSDFDPNYKIYHEDIYALNLNKRGKKKKSADGDVGKKENSDG